VRAREHLHDFKRLDFGGAAGGEGRHGGPGL
jgi:hypothetical protein